jgi:hypothetical protein
MVTVPYDTYNRDRRRLLAEGNIVFLNDVDYDTSKVSRTEISQVGISHGSGTFQQLA